MFRYNDEELLYLSRQGCKVAYHTLLEQYYQYIKSMIYKMKIHSQKYVDENDIMQVAMVQCMQAFDSYRPDRDCKLTTFMSWVIRNSIYTSIKRVNNEQHRYYMHSLDAVPMHTESLSYTNMIRNTEEKYQPKEQLYIKETKAQYQGYIETHGSTLEQDILEYRIGGYSNQEIAKVLHLDIKTIYNAVYRLQKKLEKLKKFD